MATTKTPLLPEGDHFISLQQAREMTALYRAQKENILAPEFKGKDILSVCETFNRAAFDALLTEDSCAGIRIYFGMNPEMQIRVIAVAVDQNGRDILPAEGAKSLEGAKIVEDGQICPPWCPPPPPPQQL